MRHASKQFSGSRPWNDDKAMNLIRGITPGWLGITLALIPAVPAGAQTTIGASIGLQPTSPSLIKERGGVNGGLVPYPVLEVWTVGALVFSGYATRGISRRVGIEAKFSVSSGRVDTRDSLNLVVSRAGHLMIVSARAPIQISPAASPFVVHFSPGLAIETRGGGGWNGITGTTDPALVLALDGGGLFGRRSKFNSRLMLEAYLSMAQFNSPTFRPTGRRFHQDLILTVGFDYRLKRR